MDRWLGSRRMACNIKDEVSVVEHSFQAEHFINRELSWLEFNQRVLEEAEDTANPLLERVKFLSIFSSNLDEFFMVRVAGLREQAFGNGAPQDYTPDGLRAITQLQRIAERTQELVAAQYRCWNESVLPQLAGRRRSAAQPRPAQPCRNAKNWTASSTSGLFRF